VFGDDEMGLVRFGVMRLRMMDFVMMRFALLVCGMAGCRRCRIRGGL
jgi:hypothetical protein